MIQLHIDIVLVSHSESCREYNALKEHEEQAILAEQMKEEYKQHSKLLADLAEAELTSETGEKQGLPLLKEARYVGVGYNLVRGAPEGTFRTGGVDPGIKITHHILRFTYHEDKSRFFHGKKGRVPDQVNYQLLSSCSGSNKKRLYSGAKSYQSNLATSVQGEG